jgi:hypothetical protein
MGGEICQIFNVTKLSKKNLLLLKKLYDLRNDMISLVK